MGLACTSWCTTTPPIDTSAMTMPWPMPPPGCSTPCTKLSAAATPANTHVPSCNQPVDRPARAANATANANTHMAPSENSGSSTPAGPKIFSP
ncbi:hypothetical protein BBK82_13125 [Lentzea guizhouensis]|uniref:Uncharacterized protein n=1 Tax=Lentzea guizhouensis TaxID=1586287 RepID=A0A1B2HGM7_9PSEU|nr:hypothetical protein [Lentzea guizhouensis]ANZ36877.1 hypothetical protein BBK82_13125 [Lentzea guizhouensis]